MTVGWTLVESDLGVGSINVANFWRGWPIVFRRCGEARSKAGNRFRSLLAPNQAQMDLAASSKKATGPGPVWCIRVGSLWRDWI